MQIQLRFEALELRETPAAAFETLPVLPFSDPGVFDHARAIVSRGQQLGRSLDRFARFGDSNSSTYSIFGTNTFPFLNPLGTAQYNPSQTNLVAGYPDLLDTWQVYRSTVNSAGKNSFSWVGPGAWGGWGTKDVLAAMASVVQTSNPAIALIMIGTNEVINVDALGFKTRLREVVDTLTSNGILPVLSTIPPYLGLGGVHNSKVSVVNQVIADVAAVERVPLWNFWRVCVGLANNGLVPDGNDIHLTVSQNGAGSFFSDDLGYAQNVRNLQALQILDWFRERVAIGPTYLAPNSTWQEMNTGRQIYAVGRDVGFSPTIDVFDATSGERINRFLAFEAAFGGGVRVATGDVNGDGFTDVVCATTAGTVGRVRVYSGKDGSRLANRVSYGSGYTNGVSVAVGDLDGDSIADIVVGQLAGGNLVRVYRGGSLTILSEFRAFPRSVGGVSVAVANVETLGPVIAMTSTTMPVVRLCNLNGEILSVNRPLPGAVGGFTLTTADLTGDGYDELFIAPITNSPRVFVFDPLHGQRFATFAVGPVIDEAYGIRLGAIRHSTGTDTVLVGNAPGSAVSVRAFDDLMDAGFVLPPSNSTRSFGIFVG